MDRFRIGGDVFLKKSQNELPRRTHVKAFRRGQLRKRRSRRDETSLNKFKMILKDFKFKISSRPELRYKVQKVQYSSD